MPCARPDAVDHTSFNVEQTHAVLCVGTAFASLDCLDLAAVTARACVVKVGDN